MPKTLVEAFKATLEELDSAHLLLHVLDASDPHVDHHMASVESILKDLGLDDRDILLVWNKADIADPERLDALMRANGGHAISAVTGEGCDLLLQRIEHKLFEAGHRTRTPEA